MKIMTKQNCLHVPCGIQTSLYVPAEGFTIMENFESLTKHLFEGFFGPYRANCSKRIPGVLRHRFR